MTKSTITREQAQKIIVAADEVITALAGTNEDVHPDDSKKMCELWDDLNDRHAPPVVVRELARMALTAMDSEPVAEVLSNRPGNDTSTIDVALPVGTQLYRHAQPSPVGNEFIPKNLDRALGVLGMALPESKEEFNLQSERWIQRLIDRVIRYADEFKAQPAPVVPESICVRQAISALESADAATTIGQAYKLGWNACRAAMLAAAQQEEK